MLQQAQGCGAGGSRDGLNQCRYTHTLSLSLSLSLCVCVVTSGDVPYLYLRIAQLCDLIVVVMVVHVARPRNPGQTDAPVLACSPGQGPHQPPH